MPSLVFSRQWFKQMLFSSGTEMTTADAGENYGKPLRGYLIECLKEETLSDIIRKGLICVLCRNILRSPVQVPCGARYCEDVTKACSGMNMNTETVCSNICISVAQ